MSENESEETVDETAAEAEDNTQVADAGVPGQIQYPDREVDAERAAAFAGGKVDTLEPEDEEADEEADEDAEEDAEE